MRITVDLGLCAGERLEVESCPTAQGIVQGSDNNDGTIKVEQLEGGSVVESQVTKISVVTKLRGEVGTNAKLKTIEIDRTETYDTSIDYGRWLGVGQRANIRRTATISMPSGQYLAGTGSLDVQQSFRGLLSFLVNTSAAREAAIASWRRTSDESWSKFVDEAIKKYRERETAWQKPVCAELAFAPRSNTLRVRRGQQGLFTGTVRATRGGNAEGEWRITARRNLGLRLAGNSTAAANSVSVPRGRRGPRLRHVQGALAGRRRGRHVGAGRIGVTAPNQRDVLGALGRQRPGLVVGEDHLPP